MHWAPDGRRYIMKIEGLKSAFPVIVIIWAVSAAIPVVSFCTDPDNLGAIVFCVLLALAMALPASYLLIKQGLTYYTLDGDGITEHFFSHTRTFRWDECRFIKQVYLRSRYNSVKTIVCCKSGLPYGMPESKIYSYHWPNKDTIRIGNRPDSVYQEFLTWCGGERDIRE